MNFETRGKFELSGDREANGQGSGGQGGRAADSAGRGGCQGEELLVSISGVGKKTSARLMGEIGDISRFENAPQLAAYAGLNPKGFSSGSSVHKKTRISKQGRSELRACLYMPAIVAMTHNPVVRALKERLQKRQLPTMAIVVACMRKLLHIVYGVLKSQRPFDPDYDRQFNYSA